MARFLNGDAISDTFCICLWLSPSPSEPGLTLTPNDFNSAQVTMQLRNGLFMSAGPFFGTGVSGRVDQADRSDARAVWTARKDGRKGFKFEAMGLNREASGADHWTSGTGWWLSRCKQVTNWDASEETIRVTDLKGGWFSLETDQSGGPVEVFIEHAAVSLAAVKVGYN